MTKTNYWLTKSDRENIIYLHAAEDILGRVIKDWTEHKRPEEWLAPISAALAELKTAQGTIKEYVSDENLKKMWRQIYSTHRIALVTNFEAGKIQAQPDAVYVEEQSLFSLAEAVLVSQCRGCSIQDHESCKYRSALMAASIPPWEDPTPDDVCQYRYEDGDEDMGTPVPSAKNENVRGAGPVTKYQLSPEELAALPAGKPIDRSHHKPFDMPQGRQKPTGEETDVKDGRIKEGPSCGLTKLEFLKGISTGESISSIERAWKMKNQTLTYWVKAWDLRGITPGKARELLQSIGVEADAKTKNARSKENGSEPDTASPEKSTSAEDGESRQLGDVPGTAEAVAPDPEALKEKDAEIERLREDLAKAIGACIKNSEIAASNQLECVKANDELRKLEREIGRLNADNANAQEAIQGRERTISRLIAELKEVKQQTATAVPNLPAGPQAFVTLALPLIDTGEDGIEQRLRALETLGELKTKIDMTNVSFPRLAAEVFELLQVIAGVIYAQTADIIVDPAEIPGVVQKFFSEHNARHSRRTMELAADKGWKVIGL